MWLAVYIHGIKKYSTCDVRWAMGHAALDWKAGCRGCSMQCVVVALEASRTTAWKRRKHDHGRYKGDMAAPCVSHDLRKCPSGSLGDVCRRIWSGEACPFFEIRARRCERCRQGRNGVGAVLQLRDWRVPGLDFSSLFYSRHAQWLVASGGGSQKRVAVVIG